MVSSVPLTSVRSPSPVPTTEGGEETKEEGEEDKTQNPQVKSPIITTPQEDVAVQEPEAVPLVVPATLFRPTSYHPMHIFVSYRRFSPLYSRECLIINSSLQLL